MNVSFFVTKLETDKWIPWSLIQFCVFRLAYRSCCEVMSRNMLRWALTRPEKSTSMDLWMNSSKMCNQIRDGNYFFCGFMDMDDGCVLVLQMPKKIKSPSIRRLRCGMMNERKTMNSRTLDVYTNWNRNQIIIFRFFFRQLIGFISSRRANR